MTTKFSPWIVKGLDWKLARVSVPTQWKFVTSLPQAEFCFCSNFDTAEQVAKLWIFKIFLKSGMKMI